jgi:pyruvate/2-oxoglutarate dehydrogenase complex dihydrolipoamide dehydrogenase (E3) component
MRTLPVSQCLKAERLIVGAGWVGVSLAHILRNLGVHLRGQATGREEGVSKDEHHITEGVFKTQNYLIASPDISAGNV